MKWYRAILLMTFTAAGLGCGARRTISDVRLMAGECNVIVGTTAEFYPNDSYQVVIKPDTRLQREYAIEAVYDAIDKNRPDGRCLATYQEALRQLAAAPPVAKESR